ncbi:ACT domain-containing protein, partial [Klebsiella pneumoniae]
MPGSASLGCAGKRVEWRLLPGGAYALREIVLINITGEDRPGLTAAITGV